MPDKGSQPSFSQRMGLSPEIKVAQIDSLDLALKNGLWNVLVADCFVGFSPRDRAYSDRLKGSNFHAFADKLYDDFYKAAIDTVPTSWSSFKKVIRDSYFNMEWHRVYSFVEFIVAMDHRGSGSALTKGFNRVLERENSAYRFVAGFVTPVTSTDEIKEVENAITASNEYAGVRTHLLTALGLLSDRQKPDYRNSIKESISAIESLSRQLVGLPSATFDGTLKVLEKSHKLHPALKKAFSALYGYTSDSDGIRHALMENSELTKADAQFMLICCSAFVNFTINSISLVQE